MAYLQKFQDEHRKIGYKKEDTIVVECIYDEGEMSFGKSGYSNKPYGVVLKAKKAVNRKPILPQESEISSNTRARSAKLRIAEKTTTNKD